MQLDDVDRLAARAFEGYIVRKDLAWEHSKFGFKDAVVVGHDHRGLPKARVAQPQNAGMDRRVQALRIRHVRRLTGGR